MNVKIPTIRLTIYGVQQNSEYRLPAQYIDCVRRAGGIPVLLPPGEKEIKSIGNILDGIILCRGGDINVARYGGTLHEHIPDVFDENILHRLSSKDTTRHDVEINQGSKLYSIVKCRKMEVVSWHHQAAKKIPDELTISAQSNSYKTKEI